MTVRSDIPFVIKEKIGQITIQAKLSLHEFSEAE
jgi:hypothetical protein